jgi:L-2-hydroxyglutarate oxidase LhgO
MGIPRQNGHANGDADDTGRTRQRKVVIVGAGPVGCLAAIALANKGWSVEVYEGRAGVALFPSPLNSFVGLSLRQAPGKVGRGAAFN